MTNELNERGKVRYNNGRSKIVVNYDFLVSE